MPSSFVPLSQISSDVAKRYFAGAGVRPETVEWKYFDHNFNQGRERGYGWIQNGEMRGFIGLIPFVARDADRCIETAWTCDWGLDQPGQKGGAGVMLVWQAFRSYPVLFGLGGNERSRELFPRMATRTIEGAAIALYLALRLGAAVRALRRLNPSLKPEMLGPLGRMPVRRLPSHPRRSQVKVEPGVSRAILPLLERAEAAGGWRPMYDFGYLDWQIGRSPDLQGFTVYLPSDRGPKAAALLWHARKSPAHWRMALLGHDDEQEETGPVLSCAVHHAYSNGAHLLAALVSHHDTARIEALKGAGFIAAPNTRSLYALAGKNKPLPIEDLRGLSYLDTDLAHLL